MRAFTHGEIVMMRLTVQVYLFKKIRGLIFIIHFNSERQNAKEKKIQKTTLYYL